MSSNYKPRLRHFENSPAQSHIEAPDRYLFAHPAAKFRLNVIGTGTIGQEHMRVATLLGRAKIKGIYDEKSHSMDVAEQGFATYSDDKLVRYDSLEAACEDPEVDGLIICTPNFSHLQVLDVALQSGKAILLEKPMATTLGDAATILQRAESYSGFIQVGLQYRYKAIYTEARREALQQRAVGNIKTISLVEHRPPFLDKVGQWNKFDEFTGGTLIEKCCHYFDLMNLFAESRPVSVYATANQAVSFVDFKHEGRQSDIADSAFVIVEYENGIKANLGLSMFCPNFYEELVLCGDGGRLKAAEQFDFQHDSASRSTLDVEHGEEAASRSMQLGYPTEIERSGHHGATFYEHIAFCDNLEGKKTDSATVSEGLWSIIVGAAATESSQIGQPVVIADMLRSAGLDALNE